MTYTLDGVHNRENVALTDDPAAPPLDLLEVGGTNGDYRLEDEAFSGDATDELNQYAESPGQLFGGGFARFEHQYDAAGNLALSRDECPGDTAPPWFVLDGADSNAFTTAYGAGCPDDYDGVGPCNAADVAEPYGTLDGADVNAFIASFGASNCVAKEYIYDYRSQLIGYTEYEGSYSMTLAETRHVYDSFNRRIITRTDDAGAADGTADGIWDEETLLLYDGQARWQLSEERDLLGTPDADGRGLSPPGLAHGFDARGPRV